MSVNATTPLPCWPSTCPARNRFIVSKSEIENTERTNSISLEFELKTEINSEHIPVITKGKVVHASLAGSTCLERFEHNVHDSLAR